MKKIELLAPAGDLERLKVAIDFGADAVYCGGHKFNLRANAINFSKEELKEAVEYVHKKGKKIHVTVNITPHNDDVNLILPYLKELEELGVDAVIISDLFIINEALTKTNLEVHVSTQASVLNMEAVEYYKNLGVSRIVLAREATRDEIKGIKENVDIEIETFIHGAMCAGISGRCVLSNHLTGRDANRGGCAQSCRWDYDLYEGNKLIKGDKPFTFCSKDLNMIGYVKDMIDIGIDSFKIEGRMRSIYYIATVVNAYRQIIDFVINDKEINNIDNLLKVLDSVANRESIPQFYIGNKDENSQYYNGREEVSNQDFLGVVLDVKGGIATIQQRNYFEYNDDITIFGPNNINIDMKVPTITNSAGEITKVVRHPKEIVSFKVPKGVKKDYLIRKKII